MPIFSNHSLFNFSLDFLLTFLKKYNHSNLNGLSFSLLIQHKTGLHFVPVKHVIFIVFFGSLDVLVKWNEYE